MMSIRRRALMSGGSKPMIEVVWNQLKQPKPTQTLNGVTISQVNQENYLNGTATSQFDFNLNFTGAGLTNQDYIYLHPISGGSSNTYYCVSLWYTENWGDIIDPVIKQYTYQSAIYLALRIYANTVFDNKLVDINIIDITTMFAGHTMLYMPTVAQFEAWITENGINLNSVIAYDAGSTRMMTKPDWIA